jgi:hypothetical protein
MVENWRLTEFGNVNTKQFGLINSEINLFFYHGIGNIMLLDLDQGCFSISVFLTFK